MARNKPANHGRPWTPQADKNLKTLAHKNTPTGLIAHGLGRTEGAVRGHASDIHVSLKPTNQTPYNRRKGK